MKKQKIKLTQTERRRLESLIHKGQNKVRVITRARIILLSNAGKKDQEVAEALGVGLSTVERIRRRCVKAGVEVALKEKPRPGKQRLLNHKQEAELVAVACSVPPLGYKRWSVRMLMREVVKRGIVEQISFETVRLTLKKTMSSRGA